MTIDAMASTTAESADVRARRTGGGVAATDSSYNLEANAHRKGDRIRKLRSKKLGVNRLEVTTLPPNTMIGTPINRPVIGSRGKRPQLTARMATATRDDVR